MKSREKTRTLLSAVCLGMVAGFHYANAASVVYEETGFVTGEASRVNAFYVSTAGTYKASLADYHYGDAFDSLRFTVTAESTFGNTMNILSAPGDDTFYATPGVYYATFAGAMSDNHSVGLYGVQIKLMDMASVPSTPAPIPLPPAIWLFVSALASTGLWFKKNKRKIRFMH